MGELSDIKEEMEREEKYKKESFLYLQERYDNTKEEYDFIEEKLNIEISQVNSLTRKENELNSEYIGLIRELFLSILDVFERFDRKKLNYYTVAKEKINNDNVDIYIKEAERILRDMEDFLNSKLWDINSFKDNDSKFFKKQKNKI